MLKIIFVVLTITIFLGLGVAPSFSQSSYSFDITSFPYSAEPPDYIDDYTLPVSGAWSLVGDDYQAQVTQSNWQSGMELRLIDYDLAPDVYPQSISASIYSDSNNATCDANIFRYILIYFMQGDVVMYPDPFGRTAIVGLNGSANTSQTLTINFATTNIYNTSIKLNTLSPDEIRVTIGTLCAGTSASRTITQRVGSISFDYIHDSDEDDYIRPLSSDNLSSITTDGTTVIAVSDTGFSPVHAGIGGTVSVTPLVIADCNALGATNCVVNDDPLSTVNTFKVVITGITTITYLVQNAGQYILDGSVVTAGCVLGETMVGSLVTGVTLLSNGDENLEDFLTIEPDGDTPCNEVPGDDNPDCLNDPFDSSSWYKQGNVSVVDGDFVLGAGGKIYQLLSMPRNAGSRMLVTSSAGTIITRLGNTASNDTLPIETTVSIDWDVHTPNVVDFWEASVQNKGESPVTISLVCVEIQIDNEGTTGNVIPTQCYFMNHNFSDGLDGWGVNSGVSEGTSVANLMHNGGLSQSVTLYAGDTPPKEYTLEIEYELWYGASYTPDYDDNINEVTISYAYPYDDNSTANTFEDFETLTFAELLDNPPVKQTSVIEISEDVDGDIFIRVSVDSVAGVRGIAINRICLYPNDGEWVGYTDPNPTPFTETCETLASPQGNDIGRWVSWHWHNLSQFFQCDLMITLNNSYGLFRWFQSFTFMFFQWLSNDVVMWLDGHMSNIVKAITNTQIYQNQQSYELPPITDIGGDDPAPSAPQGLSTIQNFEYADCNWYDVFCHGQNLIGGTIGFVGGVVSDFVGAILNFIGTLLATIVDWITWGWRQFWGAVQEVHDNFQTVLSAIRDFIQMITDLINQVTNLWNEADPLAPPGIDDCSISPDTKPLCLIYWVLENTFLSGEYGNLIVPLMVSVIGIIGFVIVSNRFVGIVRSARNA